MDGHKQIDDEIAAMLAVEPSPEFLARVRARVAREPEPAAWRWSWLFATAGAVAVVLVVVMVWPPRKSASPNGAPEASPQIAKAVETVAPRAAVPAPEAAAAPRRTPQAARAVAVVASPDGAIEIDLPEVLIADNEVRTFASLVRSIRQSNFDAAVPVAPDPDTPLEVQELAEPAPVLVEPIDIEPIVMLAAHQPEGERP